MLKLSIPQSKIWAAYSKYRFLCVCAGRRGGKSKASEVLLIRAASEPNQVVWYVAPTYRMAKRLMWRGLKLAIDKELIVNRNETELSIELINGSIIQLFGADNPDGLVGASLNACFVDEAGLMSNLEQVIERSIRPALADKQGQLVLLTTPRGYNYFYTLCSRAWNFPYPRADRVEPNNNWWFYSFTTIEGGNVTAEELADAASTMPKNLYQQEFLAQFTTPANRVYDNYDFTANELDESELKTALRSRQLLVGIDFNVNPMNAVIAVAKGDECHVVDSIEVMASNTEELCQEIKTRYPGYQYLAFPDPSGKARKTSASVGITDFIILERNGFTVYAPNSAPLIVDRVNAVQAMLCSADGKRRLLVHKRAKTLIQALNGQCYKEGTSIPQKGGVPDLSGPIDALGYLVFSRFNLFKSKTKEGERVY